MFKSDILPTRRSSDLVDRKQPWSKVGHSVSHIIDARQRNIMFVNQDQMRIRGGLKLQRSTSLEHIGGMTLDLAVSYIKISEVMMTRQRVDERSKRITQTHDEMSPTRHECRQVPCSRATYHRHDDDTGSIFSPPFLASTSLFLHKLEEDTICLSYKFFLRKNQT